MRTEIGSEVKRVISSVDGYYSRLSDSILERMESSMLSLGNNISDSFASLSDSTSLSIKSLNSSVDSSVKDMTSNLQSGLKEFLDNLSTRGQQGIKEAHSLMESHSEKSMKQMAGLLASNMDAYRDSVDSFMEKWSTVLESRMDTSAKEMQENTNRVYKDALDRNESIISQNLDLFEKTSKEFHELGTGLKQMHEVYRERLDQTAQVIAQAVRGFRDMLEKEHETNEELSEKNIKGRGNCLKRLQCCFRSNQAEMNASLSMFVQGIDSLLQGFQVKAGEKDEEQTLVQNLEKSLNELTEKSNSVLSEYVARSREIYSGLLENQLHLTRKIEEMTGGQN